MTEKCGAKTRQGGEPCKNPPVSGKTRCRMHGGRSTGPVGHANAMKHGIYSDNLSVAEGEQWADVLAKVGSIDDELTLCRFRLMRAMKAEEKSGDAPELDEVRVTPGRNGPVNSEKKYKQRDYNGVIERLLGRIESLEKTRAQLLDAGGEGAGLPTGFEVVPYDDAE